jgi:hypothetical protein
MVTNVYAPCERNAKPQFLAELLSIGDNIVGPWIVLGDDFNLTRAYLRIKILKTSTLRKQLLAQFYD